MADGKRREPGAQLEELNDQLARFLQHADTLLEDWARFGAQVRSTVDAEVARIESGAADAADRAVKQLGAQVDRVAHDRVEKAIGDGLTRLKAELDRAGRATAVAAPVAPPPNRALVGAVVLANVLLVVLIAVTLLRGRGPAAVAHAPIDAAVVATDPGVLDACTGLIEAWSEDDAAIVVRAGVEACGPYAADVEKLFAARLAPPPMDAGVVDAAPPIDAKKKPR